MSRGAAGRGQTLLLFALTMLLVVLMVCMTLSIAMKAREKMEVQNLADAAAFSNAVTTARVYNEVSLMNRAQTAQMVSMAGVQSAISWSSFYRAQVEATLQNYGSIRSFPYGFISSISCPCAPFNSGCARLCSCSRQAMALIDVERNKLRLESTRIRGVWDSADSAAATQVFWLQGAATALWGFELARYMDMVDELDDQSLANDVVRSAVPGTRWGNSELRAPGSADDVSKDELGPFSVDGAAVFQRLFKDHHISAAMGSRGFTFTTTRGGSDQVITAKIKTLINRRDVVLASGIGSAYWADQMNHGRYMPGSRFSWADDHGQNFTVFTRGRGPCPTAWFASRSVTADVKSTDQNDRSDQHRWSPRSGADAEPPMQRHTLGPCLRCPGMWPMFMDYNSIKLVSPGDNWGQPKNYAVVQRDYRARNGSPDPWNLLFNYRFDSSGAGTTFDNRGIRLGPNFGNMDISRQTALATGIAYYHRKDHWQEPPNFLNPFWKATLVPLDIDSDGRGRDPARTLRSANAPWAAEALNELRGVGYRGWQ